jgi:hypothetical protein
MWVGETLIEVVGLVRFSPVLTKERVIAKNLVGYAHGTPGNFQIFELS